MQTLILSFSLSAMFALLLVFSNQNGICGLYARLSVTSLESGVSQG